MMTCCFVLELTLGFERELYEFQEPIASSSQVREMVCVAVRAGNVGTALIITPMWIPNSATRESKTPTKLFEIPELKLGTVYDITCVFCSWC